MLRAQGISLTGDQNNAPVLRSISLTIDSGQRVLLRGASGSGKTSLLSVLSGLVAPSDGAITYCDGPINDGVRARHFGFVFQKLHLIPTLTLRQNLLLSLRLAGLTEDRELALSALTRVGIGDKADRKPASISHGEAQRVAIARAMIHRPAIIFADEPTSALDDDNARVVTDLLLDQAKQTGATLIVATHDNRIEPAFNRVITMDKGRIAA